jgi:hypothetical protein
LEGGGGVADLNTREEEEMVREGWDRVDDGAGEEGASGGSYPPMSPMTEEEREEKRIAEVSMACLLYFREAYREAMTAWEGRKEHLRRVLLFP